jgi:uncharacterized coiled-coil DUF342 family protein
VSDNDKAPAWRVVTISNYNGDKKWCVHEGDRLVMWTGKHDDAHRIVEAVNGVDELRAKTDKADHDASWAETRADRAGRERDELRAELAAAQAKIVNVQADRDHVIRQRNEALASLGAVRCERDELRAELAALRALSGGER